jgi:formylglycine-generating enzyme required for sulfatase activity
MKNMPLFLSRVPFILGLIILNSCKNPTYDSSSNGAHTLCVAIPTRYASGSGLDHIKFNGDTSTIGMVLIPGGSFDMGGDNEQANEDEYLKHSVKLDPFFMDATEVTNEQFEAFINATGYLTTAERKPDWKELSKTLPAGTPKPHDSLLVAASLVFKPTSGPVNLNNYSQWWELKTGADRSHPQRPKATNQEKKNIRLCT